MVTHQNGIWKVPLAAHHSFYEYVDLRRDLPNNSEYSVVVVDMRKFMACFEREMPSYLVPEVAAWTDEKRDGLRRFLDPKAGAPPMPRAGIRIEKRKRLLGLLKSVEVAIVMFTNGRHRARYLQGAGALYIPIEVHKSNVVLFNEFCF